MNVTDVFSTDDDTRSIEVVVNGQSEDVDNPTGTLKSFAVEQARIHGIRTFSVYADGVKVTEDEAGHPISGVEKLEIVAKDARG